jgi:hypothetical protein
MTPQQEALFRQIVGYCVSIYDGKPQPQSTDLPTLQHHVVYSQAFGSIRLSVSYWSLRDENRNYEAHVLARNLFERLVNTRYSAASVTNAARLAASMLGDRVKKLNQLLKVAEPEFKASLEGVRDRDQAEYDRTVSISGLGPDPVVSNFFSRAEAIGLDDLYRSLYFSLSEFTHPPIKRNVIGTMDAPPAPSIDMLSFLAPLETALEWEEVRDPVGCQAARAEFLRLHDQVSIALFE